MGFASPALQLADRDHWIGWALGQRRTSLHTVVNISRLLIRPSVRCANLASRVLAIAVLLLPEDFQRRYGYRPFLLESFVDSARFADTCYQAANWIRIAAADRVASGRPARQSKISRCTGWRKTFALSWGWRPMPDGAEQRAIPYLFCSN